MTNLPKFTVCMSVYYKSKPAEFLAAFESIVDQTVPPDEIILVVDGPIPDDLEEAVKVAQNNPSLQLVRLPENKGHATVRQTGLELASHSLVGIMDGDDLSLPDRFELQLQYLIQHPEVDIVGGQICEFYSSSNKIIGKREVPLSDSDIKKYLKRRSPFNFVTVMFKRESVMKVGGFMEWFCEEDYYLWIRMALANCRFANLDNTLVKVRIDENTYHRRGGWKYFISEAKIQVFMLKHHIISFIRACVNISIRFVVQVLMPNSVRAFFFRTVFRNKN